MHDPISSCPLPSAESEARETPQGRPGLRLVGDVIVLPVGTGRWIIYNLRSRQALGVEADALALLGNLPATPPQSSFAVWEIDRFTNEDGLLADPTRFVRPEAWGKPRRMETDALVSRCAELALLYDGDEEAYGQRFAAKTSIVDTRRLGNFHQQMGRHLLLRHKQDPVKWWVEQKFEPDFSTCRPNLYRTVQEASLRTWIPKRFGTGQSVADLGCGVGFYTNLIAQTGAIVLGVDPNADYVEKARARGTGGASYVVADIGAKGGLDSLPSGAFDAVLMSDALLFYFVPPIQDMHADVDVLLADIRRILKPDGRFISIEPHGEFWLAPWLGDADRPYTIISSHAHRWFEVMPPMAEFVDAVCRRGFAARHVRELYADPDTPIPDKRAWRFAREFPLWQLVEFQPAS